MKKNLVIFFSLGLCVACSNDASQAELKQREIEAIQSELVALKPEQTCSADTQCVPLGIGAKPCGGPSGYLPLSIMSPNKESAESKAQRHTALSKELFTSDAVGDCSIAPVPTLACVDSKCVATNPNYVPPF